MQKVTVVDGIVTRCEVPEGDMVGKFLWDGTPVKPGDPDPRPVEDRTPNHGLAQVGLGLLGSTEAIPYAVQKWLELFGDWINDLHFSHNGVYRSQQELVGEWIARMNGTYTP